MVLAAMFLLIHVQDAHFSGALSLHLLEVVNGELVTTVHVGLYIVKLYLLPV